MRTVLILALLLNLTLGGYAQSPHKFDGEMSAFAEQDKSIDRNNIILFTGSSTIRMWKDIKTDLPGFNILNRGFGGSQATDLLHYVDRLILPYKPRQIFIYEGDNDLNAGKSTEQILATNDSIVLAIRKNGIKAQVFFISAKPSVARWRLKDKYEQYNQQLKVWTAKQKDVSFIDVFTPMLDAQGAVKKDIFLEDGLHMNRKGYAIWTKVIQQYVR